MPFEIVTLACLEDNFNNILHDPETGDTIAIDAPEDPALLAEIAKRGWTLSAIWLTHYHWDHIDGVPMLLEAFPDARVIGPAADQSRLPPLDQGVMPRDHLSFAGEEVVIIDASGHTDVHIAYYFPKSAVLFSADSLMTLSCGRVSGTIDQMKATFDRFAALPDHVQVYSGHEYSAVNSAFAKTIEPDNTALLDRIERLRARREAGEPTVPNTIGEEKATNPFFRTHIDAIKAATNAPSDAAIDVFTRIRTLRNNF